MAIDTTLIENPAGLGRRKVTMQTAWGDIEGRIEFAREDRTGVHFRIKIAPQRSVTKSILWVNLGYTGRDETGAITLGLNRGEIFTIHADDSFVERNDDEVVLQA